MVVGKKTKVAKVIYLIKNAEEKDHKFVLTNMEWLEKTDAGPIPVDKEIVFKKGVNYLTGMQNAVYEEGTEDLLISFQSIQDINTKRYFNSKLIDEIADLYITPTEEENLNTLDNISTSIILVIISLVGLLTTTVILRKKVRANDVNPV